MFKFTIRDLVFLTLISALSIGWWMERQHLAGALEKLAIHEAAAQRRTQRKKDEKRLKDLELTLYSRKANREYGAPRPAQWKEPSSMEIAEEIGALRDKLKNHPDE